jgi:hypothetical protein
VPLAERRLSLGLAADAEILYVPARVNLSRDSIRVPVLVRLVTTGFARPRARDGLRRVPLTTAVTVIEIVSARVMVLSPKMGNAKVGLMTVRRDGLGDRIGADSVAEPGLAVPLALKPATIHATGLPTEPWGESPGRKPRALLTRQLPCTARSPPSSTSNRPRPLRVAARMPEAEPLQRRHKRHYEAHTAHAWNWP